MAPPASNADHAAEAIADDGEERLAAAAQPAGNGRDTIAMQAVWWAAKDSACSTCADDQGPATAPQPAVMRHPQHRREAAHDQPARHRQQPEQPPLPKNQTISTTTDSAQSGPIVPLP